MIIGSFSNEAIVTIDGDGVIVWVRREASAGDGEVLSADVAVVGADSSEGGEGGELKVLVRSKRTPSHVVAVICEAY